MDTAFCGNIDYTVLVFMGKIENVFLDSVLKVVSYMGNAGAMWIVLGASMLIFSKTRKQGLFCLLSLALAALLGNCFLKPLIHRVRPFDMFEWIDVRVVKPSDGSFPSGHTMSSFAFATALLFVYKKWGIAAMIFSCFMGFSRLYFQVHFFTDVIAGMVLGILCGIIMFAIVSKIKWFKVTKELKREENEDVTV